jgi:hypothetical protein
MCAVCQRLDCLCEPNTWVHRDDPETAAIEHEALEQAVAEGLFMTVEDRMVSGL